MAWFNADDKMHGHPKVRRAGLEAIGLWLVCGTYCTDFTTDGLVPEWYINSWPKGQKLADHLVKCGFWEPATDGDFQFLSWSEYQRTKAQVLADKKKTADRVKAWREKRG